ncbi:hypothetical protein [Phaeodactylibacter luteus]|uniref:Outer membrane beta-barrel protein n=1 Tax=Phaeodactylibacter luteus TaxID=1564516 RepID=A0A5C6RYI5_9BACT|nr:hypothetical protein [Phaeodactylibacter luteus]TXB67676.1 hypothetical protein FRY97_04610 [Phaeodactylibacter luteus]
MPQKTLRHNGLCWLLLVFLSLLQLGAAGQSDTCSLYRHCNTASFSFSTGSSALAGLSYAKDMPGRWAIRYGIDFMDFSLRKWETNFNRFAYYASINLDVRQTALTALWDYSLTHNGGIRLVGGMAFFFNNQISGSIKLRDAVQFNDIAFEPDELGYVMGGVRYNLLFNPYLGLGLGHVIDANRRVSISADLGAYYKGAPEIFVDGTSLIRNNEHNAKVLTRNLSPYRWYPVVNIRIGFSFNPE